MSLSLECLPGRSFPLGAMVYPSGVNFSIYSRSCTALELLLFDHPEAPEPARVIHLHPRNHRTAHYWHCFVPGLGPGQVYAYRAHGPMDPGRGVRFDPEKVLLDPYGRGVVVPQDYSRMAASRPGDNVARAMRSVVADRRAYDWKGDTPLCIPFSQTVIYEMHVAGFTRHPSSGVAPERRGAYLGLVEKIPYLKDLGITAVELLPVFQFDAQEAPPGLTNYWGYNPVSFFAPHQAYRCGSQPLDVLREFRDMVKAFHQAGIEVILDVVYNHTAESDEAGPTLSFRGLENRVYYILEEDASRYANFSGTGNTMNTNHAIVRRLILDSLRYWVQEMHVDGFRFDLAAILSRDERGRPLANPPIIWDIESDPVLAGTKLIAEAWDADGLYQVGSFIGDHWKEWNGKFRDDVRAWLKEDEGMVSKIASRFLASPDLYAEEGREAEQSINFITCHDGFTLNDLVTYSRKHNEANGEGNRDGREDNRSWNCGVEGPTTDPEIEALRLRQIKNFFTLTLLSLGVPMLLMGDEVRRTQQGNNNAYCQDNEISWFDWSLVEKNQALVRFVRRLIAFRARLNVVEFLRNCQNGELSLVDLLHQAQVTWHGVKLFQPDWSDASHSLAFSLRGAQSHYHFIFNAFWQPLEFEIPPPPQGWLKPCASWRYVVDTSKESPEDFWNGSASEANAYLLPHQSRLIVESRSIVVLAAPDQADQEQANPDQEENRYG